MLNKLIKSATCTLLSIPLILVGCSRDAEVVSRNLSDDADNFKVERRIVFYNGITDKYILSIEGKCSFNADTNRKVDVTCKVGEGQYKKHSLGLSDNVTYFSEQIDPQVSSPYHYKVDFNPATIIPSINVH